jgi:hypothetical protein
MATNENAQASVTAAQQAIAAQLANASAVEARLSGFLGLMAAATAVLLTVPGALGDSRWILLTGAGASIVTIVVALLTADDVRSGPDPVVFYTDYEIWQRSVPPTFRHRR